MKVAIVLNSPSISIDITEKDVICADGGYKHIKDKDKNIIAIVGDFDSLKKVPDNIEIIKLDKEKNFTDGEQAILTAVNKGYKEVIIYGALGGRIDHVLYNINLLKIVDNFNIKGIIKDKNLVITLKKGKVNISGKIGEKLSIYPFTDSIIVSESTGLFYPLNNLTISRSDTRGISNILTKSQVYLNITKGEALIIHYFK